MSVQINNSNANGYRYAKGNSIPHDTPSSNNNNNNANNQGYLSFKWDPNNIKIRSRTVEQTLEPLISHVTSLVSQSGLAAQDRSRSSNSPSAQVLVATLEEATRIFIQRGKEILADHPFFTNDLQAAIDDVEVNGQKMGAASRVFANDPCSKPKRSDMVTAARALLLAVTRLLIVADIIDLQRLLKFLGIVEADIEKLRNATSQQEVVETYDRFFKNSESLFREIDNRHAELKDEYSRYQLASARALLMKHRPLLLTSSKTYIRHPEISEAKKNRDYVFDQINNAVTTISDVALDRDKSTQTDFGMNRNIEEELKSVGKPVAALDEFDRLINIDPANYVDNVMRPALEAALERIITASAATADFECPLKDKCRICRDKRYDRQDLFVVECNTIRQALQDLLSEYMACSDSGETTEGLTRALEHMYLKSRDLRHHLRQAAVDHLAYAVYVDPTPIQDLINAASDKDCDDATFEESAKIFRKYCKMYFDTAYLNSCMASGDIIPLRLEIVGKAMTAIDQLCPEVINAAIIKKRTSSKAASENLEEFKERWLEKVKDLTYALDRIIVLNDLIISSDSHIDKDRAEAYMALHDSDKPKFEKFATAIVARAERLYKTIDEEMALYEKCPYIDGVLSALAVFKKSKDGCDKIKNSVLRTFSETQRAEFNRGEFDRISSELLMNLKQVRYAARMDGDLDSEEGDYEENTYETRSKSSIHTDVDEFPGVAGISNTRDAYRFISDEDKQKIAIYVENFKTEKNKFDQEVAKWDDNGNDIIAMAKKMCKIMMDMTDFTRGRGPLKTTMDVINAAKKISEYGTELDKIALLIADQSPESQTKQELMSYLKEIALYCQQLKITSKVKADVQNISGSLIVSGLDSATSLIQAAKNLMNAVVSTVKASYVASTMYNQRQQNGQTLPAQTIVKWNVKVPEKKPLVRKEKSGEAWARVQRAPRVKNVTPLKALNQFL